MGTNASAVELTVEAGGATATPARPLKRELRAVQRQGPGAEPGPAPGPPADAGAVDTPAPEPRRPSPAQGVDLVSLLDDLQPALADPRLRPAALALASILAWRLGFERVSIGVRRASTVTLAAVSDAPDAATRSAAARALEAAMAEVVEHGESVLHRAGVADPLDAHRSLAEQGGARVVYSVPLRHHGEIGAVAVFERFTGEPVAPEALRACDALAGVLGPALELKRVAEAHGWLRRLPGRGRTVMLLGALLAAAWVSTVEVDYRVSAAARVEGDTQRLVVAPFDGYVDTAPVRAGDRVAAGEVLATLQDSALVLERGTWAAERDELGKQYRRALAARDWAEARVLEARMAQAEAKVALLDARLERTRITAPLAGVVLSGDLSRSLGAPVERGQVLFEVASLDGHRLELQAHERDVGYLAPGMQGTLALAALPDEPLAFTVERVSGASHTEAGETVFVVEAHLDGETPALRPGMDGVAKVAVERRSLVWIVSHRLVEWLQLQLWSLLP